MFDCRRGRSFVETGFVRQLEFTISSTLPTIAKIEKTREKAEQLQWPWKPRREAKVVRRANGFTILNRWHGVDDESPLGRPCATPGRREVESANDQRRRGLSTVLLLC